MNIEELLDLRKRKKKPKFIRQQSELSKLKKTWRKPKGLHSKLRLNKKGHRKKPSRGYGSPRKVKYLNSEGFKEILVHNIKDLENINPKTQMPKLAKIGLKNKLKILEKALTLNLKISNVKDIKKTVEEINTSLEKRKQKKKKITEKKEQTKKQAEKKTKEPEKPKEKTKEQEKKEKDKALIKKQ